MKRVFYLVLVERNLFVSFAVHKVVNVAVGIQIFHILLLDVCQLEFFRGVERFFSYGTGHHVFDLGADECCALARLNVLEVNDYVNAVVVNEGYAFSEIAC